MSPRAPGRRGELPRLPAARLLREPRLAAAPATHRSTAAISPEPSRDHAGFRPCAWGSGRAPHVAARTPSPQHSHAGVAAATSPSRSHGPSLGVRARRPRPDGRAQPVRVSPPPGPHPGPNSIVLGLMNSRALIGSPGALWIYACRLSSRGRRESCRGSFRRRGSWDSLGPWRRGAPPPGRGIAGAGLGPARPVLCPGPGPRSPSAYLPARGSPELPRWPRRTKRAPTLGAPTRGPSPHPRSEMPAGEGRPGPRARFPFLSGFL